MQRDPFGARLAGRQRHSGVSRRPALGFIELDGVGEERSGERERLSVVRVFETASGFI
jgi:hypothetical protein